MHNKLFFIPLHNNITIQNINLRLIWKDEISMRASKVQAEIFPKRILDKPQKSNSFQSNYKNERDFIEFHLKILKDMTL